MRSQAVGLLVCSGWLLRASTVLVAAQRLCDVPPCVLSHWLCCHAGCTDVPLRTTAAVSTCKSRRRGIHAEAVRTLMRFERRRDRAADAARPPQSVRPRSHSPVRLHEPRRDDRLRRLLFGGAARHQDSATPPISLQSTSSISGWSISTNSVRMLVLTPRPPREVT